jgi:digeranylgeranylglycerophospholipid reductase
MYDVVVVGAGPAGSTASRYLAECGHNVALLDKATFPRDKPCGGGFNYALIDDFDYLKKHEFEFLDGICKTGVLHSPNRKICLRGKVDLAVTLRINFDNVLFEEAVDAGTHTLTGVRVQSVHRNGEGVTIQVKGGNLIKGRVVIGADGVGSQIARDLGLHKRWDSGAITACRVAEVPAAERFIEDAYRKEREYHFYANLAGHPGYGWIFPKHETINVGLGILGSHSQGLPLIFRKYIRMLEKDGLLPEDADLTGARGALVPTGGPVRTTVVDRCLLVGDSAGMVSPLTGGGIHYAMRAARMAADVVSRGIQLDRLDSEFLSAYERMWKADFGKDMRLMRLAQKAFTGVFAGTLFEIGNSDKALRAMVSGALGENSGNVRATSLALRILEVVLKQALHI